MSKKPQRIDNTEETTDPKLKDMLDTMVEKRIIEQLSLNCRWLIEQIDRIHNALCPEKFGTWQQRAEQAVEAAEKFAPSESLTKPNSTFSKK